MSRSKSNETTDSALSRERSSPSRRKQAPQSPPAASKGPIRAPSKGPLKAPSKEGPIVYDYQNYPQSEHKTEDEKAPNGFDLHIKLLMLGDSGVGKSSLVLQYASEEFTTNFVTTIGIDYKIKLLTMGKTVIKLQIWDTVSAA